MLFTREFEENLSVCPKCDFHERIGPEARFAQIFDDGWVRLPSPAVSEDPLKFRDSKRYSDRMKAARASTREQDAFVNRSEEHTSELQSLMRNSYAVFCLKKKKTIKSTTKP